MSQAEIRPYPEGPLLVRGPIRLLSEDGQEIEIHRPVVALCRCGRSRLQPLCDGTHAVAGGGGRAVEDAGAGTQG